MCCKQKVETWGFRIADERNLDVREFMTENGDEMVDWPKHSILSPENQLNGFPCVPITA